MTLFPTPAVEYWYNRRTNRWHQWERDQNRIIHNHDRPLFCDHAPTEYELLLAQVKRRMREGSYA